MEKKEIESYERIVSFDTAKLANEKGLLKMKVNHTYTIGYNTIKEDKQLNNKLERTSVKGQMHLALAMTQYQLKMWLLVVKDIHIEMQLLRNDKNEYKDWCFYIYPKRSQNSGRIEFLQDKIGTGLNHDDAMEIALQKALKMLE